MVLDDEMKITVIYGRGDIGLLYLTFVIVEPCGVHYNLKTYRPGKSRRVPFTHSVSPQQLALFSYIIECNWTTNGIHPTDVF